MHKGEWYRYFQEAWHKYGKVLEKIPSDPHGKFRVETPTKPYWPKKKPAKKVVNKVVKKTSVKPVPKVTPKVKAPAPTPTKKQAKQEKANHIHSGMPKK